MLNVELENIVADTEAGTQLPELLRRADEDKDLIVITRNGKPAVALVNIERLESLSGHTVETATAPTPVVAPAPVVAEEPVAPTAPVAQPAIPVQPSLPPAEPDSSLPDIPLV